MDLLKQIVKQGEGQLVDGVLIDYNTAFTIITAYETLRPANQKQYAAMDYLRAYQIGATIIDVRQRTGAIVA